MVLSEAHAQCDRVCELSGAAHHSGWSWDGGRVGRGVLAHACSEHCFVLSFQAVGSSSDSWVKEQSMDQKDGSGIFKNFSHSTLQTRLKGDLNCTLSLVIYDCHPNTWETETGGQQ